MKIAILFLVILLFGSCKKEFFSPDLTDEFKIQSNITGAQYDIKVAFPQNYNPNTRGHASIYVLDGEENFDFVAKQCRKISNDLATSNVLVIGIGYGNDRGRLFSISCKATIPI